MTYDTWMLVATAASPVLTALVAIGGARSWVLAREELREQRRKDDLRLDEVLAWSFRVIANLQSIALAAQDSLEDSNREAKSLARECSILIEQGRLFFCNKAAAFGLDKHSAYQGYRPRILDPLVAAFQVATEMPLSDSSGRDELTRVAIDAEQRFVSLARDEVGRLRSASADAAQGGSGMSLHTLRRCRSKADFDQVYG